MLLISATSYAEKVSFVTEQDTVPEGVVFVLPKVYKDISFGPLLNGPGVSLSYSMIYQKSLYQGFGGGIDWSRYRIGQPYGVLAVYGKYKVHTSQSMASLFGSVQLGYGIPTSSAPRGGEIDSSGGIHGQVGGGIRLGQKRPFLELGAYFRYQHAEFNFTDFGVNVQEKINFKRLLVTVGIIF